MIPQYANVPSFHNLSSRLLSVNLDVILLSELSVLTESLKNTIIMNILDLH